jgi:hypothetical protein
MKNKINKQGKKDFNNLKNKRGKYNAGKFNEINTNKEQNFNIRENENINFISNIDAKYRNELNERMDSLMKKIDQNIMSNKYNQYNMIIHNSKVNYINNYNNVIPENNESEEKEKDEDNIENVEEEEGEINEDEKVDETSSKQDKKNEETFSLKNQNENNINSNNDNKNEEIINKLLKRTKYLENELNYLKYKLNNVESQKNFVQDIIKNDTYIKRHLFDIFTVDYFKKIALNWKTISNELIDELIMDEIHELTKVKLKLRHINRIEEDSEQEQNEEKKELSPIDMEEFILFNENLKGIKQTIKSVKESERNLCKKYKVKIK